MGAHLYRIQGYVGSGGEPGTVTVNVTSPTAGLALVGGGVVLVVVGATLKSKPRKGAPP